VHYGGMTKDQLAKRISELALLRGEFTLRSGRKSNYYLDKYRFETQPDVLRALGQMLAERVTPDIVIGDMRPSLSISARMERTLCAVMMNAYWSPYATRRSIMPAVPITRIVPPRWLGPLYRLTEPLAFAWMREMQRVLKPDGLLLVTTHGEAYLDELTDDERRLFHQARLVVRNPEAAGTNYCGVYCSEDYIRETLSDGFNLVDFIPRGAAGNPHQDLVLLRRARH